MHRPNPDRLLKIIVLLILLLIGYARLRLLSAPLANDEGVYGYIGQLMLQGIPPYREATTIKIPGTDAAYALIMAVFGQTTEGIHFGLMLVNAGAVLLVFFLGKRLFDAAAGLVASACYAILSVGTGVLGTQAHPTHFVVLPALAGTLLLLRWTDSPRNVTLFSSGLLYGVGILMKQPGVFFAAFGACLVAWHLRRRKRAAWGVIGSRITLFSLATSLPVALMFLVLWQAGVFGKFWFWTFDYARAYVSIVTLSGAIANLAWVGPQLVRHDWAIWTFAAVGLVLLWNSKDDRDATGFMDWFLVSSFFAVCPGFYFRHHYFVLLLPAVALLTGAAAFSIRRRVPNAVSSAMFAGILILPIVQQRDFLFRMNDHQISRELYGITPFPEAIQVAAYIRDHSRENARIAVLGSDPEIYFYARRRSATSYLFTNPLMEPQPFALQMHEEMIREIEDARPEYVVVIQPHMLWGHIRLQKNPPMRLANWWNEYRSRHYELVGVADIISREETVYRWDAAAAGYQPKSQHSVLVFRRNAQSEQVP